MSHPAPPQTRATSMPVSAAGDVDSRGARGLWTGLRNRGGGSRAGGGCRRTGVASSATAAKQQYKCSENEDRGKPMPR